MTRSWFWHNLIIGLSLTFSAIIFLQFILTLTRPVAPKESAVLGQTNSTSLSVNYSDQTVDQTAKMINTERQKVGLNTLTQSPQLDAVAKLRAEDMKSEFYFAHKNPNGKLFSDLLDNLGVKYGNACENLYISDIPSSQIFVSGWLASTKGHKECMLNSANKSAGYAITTIDERNGVAINETIIVAIYSDR